MEPGFLLPSDDDERPLLSTGNSSTQEPAAPVAGATTQIAVWRLEDRADDLAPSDLAVGFGSRLTHRLILVYTDPGDLVVDLDDDPAVRRACGREDRRYRCPNTPDEIEGFDPVADRIRLLVLSWPTRRTGARPGDVADVFAACHAVAAGGMTALALVSSAEPGHPGSTFAEHLPALLSAAHRAGLTQVLQIVAVASTHTGDQFRYFASPEEADAARRAAPASTAGRPQHIDVLVFTRQTDDV